MPFRGDSPRRLGVTRSDFFMVQTINYAQPLRAIGQALEVLRIGAFEVESEGEDFLVRGMVESRSGRGVEKRLDEKALQHIWGAEPGRTFKLRVVERTNDASSSPLELRYTPKDLDRLENDGRAKRSESHGMADAASLSQFLRTVGAYVNQKRARLVRIVREGESINVQYETAPGETKEEILAASDLYDFWVRMYMKRSGRRDS